MNEAELSFFGRLDICYLSAVFSSVRKEEYDFHILNRDAPFLLVDIELTS